MSNRDYCILISNRFSLHYFNKFNPQYPTNSENENPYFVFAGAALLSALPAASGPVLLLVTSSPLHGEITQHFLSPLVKCCASVPEPVDSSSRCVGRVSTTNHSARWTPRPVLPLVRCDNNCAARER